MPRLRKYDGALNRRKDAPFWWIRYRDRLGFFSLAALNTTLASSPNFTAARMASRRPF
jgi:hypothetical protein